MLTLPQICILNNVSKADCASVTAFSVATATGIDLIATEAFDVDVARASCALATASAKILPLTLNLPFAKPLQFVAPSYRLDVHRNLSQKRS